MPADVLGASLLLIARNAIAKHFGTGEQPVATHPDLEKPAASFVTLTQGGRLRGCIGSLEAYRPLAVDVAENARAAAFRDNRFSPLCREELANTHIEVSLLERAKALLFTNEAEALAKLHPGEDGLILTYGTRRATFLPQVWESLPDPQEFLTQLKIKAGLPAEFWDEAIGLARYGVKKWKEQAENH